MCGIFGEIRRTKSTVDVNEILNSLNHRGPDDHGSLLLDNCLLAMTRLSIQDVSIMGHQPMQSSDKRYTIVFNGEVYNFLELRKELESLGMNFISNSDTEVVLNAYIQFGRRALEKFRGMFAFAIWDRDKNKLFAARDRLGIKPFYYYAHQNIFVFASEIKALLTHPEIDFSVNGNSLSEVFLYGSVIGDQTIIDKINTLPPGHFIEIENFKLTISRYWDLSDCSKTEITNYEQAKSLLLQELESSVKYRLISDRPLGLFLSSGLDSVSVLALMKKLKITDIKTFTIGFDTPGNERNEADDAREIASFYHTDHYNCMINDNDILDSFDLFIKGIDQPSVDGLNTYLVSKFASKHITVALSGLGGDELFGGYTRMPLIAYKNANLFHQITSGIIPFGTTLNLLNGSPLTDMFLKLYNGAGAINVNRAYNITRMIYGPIALKKWLPDYQFDFQNNGKHILELQHGNLKGTLNKLSHLEIKYFMNKQLLRDMDALSMINSIEVRFPLIDHNLLELSLCLPQDFKISNKKLKSEGEFTYKESGIKKILLDTMLPFLPPGFEDGKKNGFKLPVMYWLNTTLRGQFIRSLEYGIDIPGTMISQIKLVETLKSIKSGKSVENLLFWVVFIYLKWHEFSTTSLKVKNV